MYRYETHCHTKEVSLCAKIPAKEVVRFYKKQGYTGLFITDHFKCGGDHCLQDKSWETYIYTSCQGYARAKEAGDQMGVDVFFGWEYTHASYIGADFLTYGLDQDWLLSHPEILHMPIRDYLTTVRNAGGLAIHAHPFREQGYIEMIRLLPRHVDGVESPNANRTPFENQTAAEYAEKYGLFLFAGTDNHRGKDQTRFCGIDTEQKVQSEAHFVHLLKQGKFQRFDIQR
ncbi:MAG TPA: histidinol phosphatase [Clostridiales bacterium]|jgi:hypothetical protein|nr:histidinol phosphatase [Clostridiales bacterium]